MPAARMEISKLMSRDATSRGGAGNGAAARTAARQARSNAARPLDRVRRAAGVQRGDHLRVPQGPPRGHAFAKAAAQQLGNFVHQAGVEHVVGAPPQPFIQSRCVPIQPDDRRVPAWCADPGGRCGERLAGELDHLQRAHDSAAIGGQDGRGRRRVAVDELRM